MKRTSFDSDTNCFFCHSIDRDSPHEDSTKFPSHVNRFRAQAKVKNNENELLGGELIAMKISI